MNKNIVEPQVVDDARRMQHGGGIHLAMELCPLFASPPANVRIHVVNIDSPANDLSEQ